MLLHCVTGTDEVNCKKRKFFETYLSFTFTCICNCNSPNAQNVSLGSSGSIVSDYRLDDRAIGVRFPAGAKAFSSNLCVQTGSGAHPASCTMGTGGPFPGGKAVGISSVRCSSVTTEPHFEFINFSLEYRDKNMMYRNVDRSLSTWHGCCTLLPPKVRLPKRV
jgi:hypothetical protein